VRRAKALWPQAECIFLANDVQQHQAAEAAGADAALLKGFPAARLVATIVRLLHQPRVQ
jgi:DNA-binding NarL/FixJ family response regulator